MSHNCENEHFEHNHNHEHGHEHTPPMETSSVQSLFQYIDTAKIRCLNAESVNIPSGIAMYKVFLKPQSEKDDCERYLQSDTDCQMILHIPFVGTCKIHSILLRTNGDDDSEGELSSPKNIKLIKNYRGNLDFETIENFKDHHTVESPQTDMPVSDIVEHHLPKNNSWIVTL